MRAHVSLLAGQKVLLYVSAIIAAQATPLWHGCASVHAEEVLPIKYWGNNESLKFHRPRCPFYKAMAEARRVPFHFRKDAVAGGYTPCNYCLPQTWTTVKATFHQGGDGQNIDANSRYKNDPSGQP